MRGGGNVGTSWLGWVGIGAAVVFSISARGTPIPQDPTYTCPEELVRIGETLKGRTIGLIGPDVVVDPSKKPVDKVAAAREAALFLIHSAYPTSPGVQEGILRSSSPAMLLHRNRLRILLGSARRVPLAFLTDLESRTRRTELAGRALEERLWNFERRRLNAEPKFQPETVRQVVTVIAKVLERKEAKPLSDFVLEHYEDALSIVGVSNEVDELRWKVISILAEEKLLSGDVKLETAPPANWFSQIYSWGQNLRFWNRPQWKKVSKDLLMALAASDHQPLDREVVRGLQNIKSEIADPTRRHLYELHLGALIQREQELAESLVSYFRHYRAAALLKKILHDLACSDGQSPLESYSVARQAMQWKLSDHPYVRHLVESGLVGATEVYHPYLCVPLPLKRDVADIEDPVLAAQALTPEILNSLFEESRRVGLEALVREWDAKAADETLAEVEKLLKQSLASVGSKVLTSAAASDPIYERLIGPALAPILDRLKKSAGVGGETAVVIHGLDEGKSPTSSEGDPWQEAEEQRTLENGRSRGTGSTREREKDKDKPKEKEEKKPREKEKEKESEKKPTTTKVMAQEPLSLLLKRVSDYLGPDSTRISWEEVLKSAVPEAEASLRKSDDFAATYAWVDRVYDLLNHRAEEIRGSDLELETLIETEKVSENGQTSSWTADRQKTLKKRDELIVTFLNVQHAIEACIIGQQGIRARAVTDDQISGDALRVAVFFLKKHRTLGRFLVNHANRDPSLRELWVRVFLRMASGHLDLSPGSPFPMPNPSEPVPSLWNRWGKIAAYGCSVLALTVGGSVVMMTKGCSVDRAPPTAITRPVEKPVETKSTEKKPRGPLGPAEVRPSGVPGEIAPKAVGAGN